MSESPSSSCISSTIAMATPACPLLAYLATSASSYKVRHEHIFEHPAPDAEWRHLAHLLSSVAAARLGVDEAVRGEVCALRRV